MNNNSDLYVYYRKNAQLISLICQAEDHFRKQFYRLGSNLIAEITSQLGNLCSYPQYCNLDCLRTIILKINSALESYDFVLCADSLNSLIYEVILPIQQAVFNVLTEYISQLYESISEASNGLIVLEETIYGFPTLLYHSKQDRYLCSTENPLKEAFVLANEAFTPEASSYHIWGVGLGYHIYSLFKTTNCSTDIYVYDNDKCLIDLAYSKSLGEWQSIFDNPHIHLVWDPDLTRFSASFSDTDAKFLIHAPSLHKLPEFTQEETERKKILKKIQITLNTYPESKRDILINLYKNTRSVTEYAEELFPLVNDKNVIIIAAGPSLDKNIDVLKSALDSGVPVYVIAVCTVLKKLINKEIFPDLIVAMDASELTYTQICGLEHLNIPLLLSTATYFGFAQNYSGKKYLACQKDYEQSEKLGHFLFNTGGSVTTLALDFAIQGKAKKIIMMGCDLAYTDNVTHAENTADRRNIGTEEIVSVKGYNGGTVNTGLLLLMYREWIEQRIKENDAKSIFFYNSTEGGSYIEGMKHVSLSELLESIK